MSEQRSYTGLARRRHTKRSVKVIDRLARFTITVGGLATIFAVTLIMVFLLWVVLPLFTGGDLEPAPSRGLPSDARDPVHVAVDEYQTLCRILRPDGAIVLLRLETGERLAEFPPPAARPTAIAVAGDELVLGFGDGTLRLGRARFVTSFLEPLEVPEAVRGIDVGVVATFGEGTVQKTPEGQFRFQTLAVDYFPPITIEAPSAVERIDLCPRDTGPVVAMLTADGRLLLREARTRKNLLTGEVTIRLFGGTLPLELHPGRGRPDHLLLAERGTQTYALWKDGLLERYAASDIEKPALAERVTLLSGPPSEVTSVCFANGRTTLLVGDSLGRLRAWFPIHSREVQTPDGLEMAMARDFPPVSTPVVAIAPSRRTRLFAVGHAGGRVRLVHLTTGRVVAESLTGSGESVSGLCIAPKDDALVAIAGGRLASFAVKAAHPDITLRALFAPVWYEGYPEPRHVWQSTGGTDDSEPKLGLVPLVFGTMKATLYSMLLGLPLALLAAIFASEFLHPRTKARIKPTIEVMASLPSVVLGFLSALVIAPFVERVVPTVMVAFVTIPLAFLGGAYLWQLIPQRLALRAGHLRFPTICLCLPAGIASAALLGPPVERLLFAGDVKMWLDGQQGGPFGGWLFLLLPLGGVIAGLLAYRVGGRLTDRFTHRWSRATCAVFDLLRFIAIVNTGLAIAALLAAGMTLLGLDPRGDIVGTWVQRNALVVGFVMGFAIIPIIFTIAEDALSAVPEHLRSASLGAGATPWQTATRIIVPTAMSGLFSATMIGLGRAVGETMIVLMAAGNTPIMDLNVFNGFRTLSANLAVELPEAVRDSTHYRTLFLAALTLFAMTFVLNTVAEAVRLRFRRRAFEL
jgi:phosphate transport system permease protein